MKYIWILCLAMLLLAGCGKQQTKIPQPAPIPEILPAEEKEKPAEEGEEPDLRWAEAVPLVEYEPSWTVDTNSEAFLLELTDAEYQGRVTGSAGNRAAADWIEQLFRQWGLLPMMEDGSYRHTYEDQIFEILPGYAAIVSADGTEMELEAGVDWIFTPSFEAVDLTLPLSADLEACQAGLAFLDGDKAKRQETVIEVSTGDVAGGTEHENPQYAASQITVTQEVYDQLVQPGAMLHLKLPAAAKDGQADNVIGFLPGKDDSHAILVSAHFDGSGQCGAVVLPSAYDNASGTAAMLQTASWLSKAESLPCDVIFAAFNGEENNKDGSRAFAQWIDGRYEQLWVLNIDCVGWKGESLTVYGEANYASLRNELAGGLGIQYKEECYSGDQTNFNGSGMFAVTVTQDACVTNASISAQMHHTYDVAENLDPSMLDDLAQKLCVWILERGGTKLSYGYYPIIW